jgi:hypothetical protein
MTLNEPEAAVELELSDWPESTQSGPYPVVSHTAESDSKGTVTTAGICD